MIVPIQDRVILKQVEESEMRESGLIVPLWFDKDKEEGGEYEVLAVGPGRYGNDGIRIPMSVQVGDHVLCNKFQLQEIKIPGEPVVYACRDDAGSIRAIV